VSVIVLIKKSKLTAVLTLAASVCALSVAPVYATDIPASVNALYGHKFLKEIKAEKPDYIVAVGRVVGKAGSIVSIDLIDPTSVSIDGKTVSGLTLDAFNWNTQLGDDVFLYYEDGSWEYLEDNTSNEIRWISRLKLKAVSDVQVSKIDWGSSTVVPVPPVQPRTVPASVPQPPVRGLW
jgi:hypothetical protein